MSQLLYISRMTNNGVDAPIGAWVCFGAESEAEGNMAVCLPPGKGEGNETGRTWLVMVWSEAEGGHLKDRRFAKVADAKAYAVRAVNKLDALSRTESAAQEQTPR